MPAVRSLGCRSSARCCGLPVLPQMGAGLVFSPLKLDPTLQFPWPGQRLRLPLQALYDSSSASWTDAWMWWAIHWLTCSTLGLWGTAIPLRTPKFLALLSNQTKNLAQCEVCVSISMWWAGRVFCNLCDNVCCSHELSVYFYVITPSSKKTTTKPLWWRSSCVH